jgi:hypothetical protein
MKTKFTLLIAVALFFAASTQAQNHNDHGYAYNKEIRKDKRDINYDRHELYRDEARGNYKEAGRDRFELNHDRRETFFDRRHEQKFDRRHNRYDRRFEKNCF